MSRSTMTVKFADGAVRYGIFNGTVGVPQPPLFDTAEEAWDWWEKYSDGGFTDPDVWNVVPTGTGEPVVANDGWREWDGTATRNHYTGPFDWDEPWNQKRDLPEAERQL